jgi:hypothetical protein
MTHDQFWKIIADTCGSDPHISDEWDTKLTEALATLSADEIIEWNHIFDELAQRAYRTDLWAAAYLINGGASDDGFYYFRCWLIGMPTLHHLLGLRKASTLRLKSMAQHTEHGCA